MAYEQQVWQPFQEGGTIITADALNHMEQGIYDAHADNSSQASDLELLTADLTAVNSSLTSVTDRVSVAETDIGSAESDLTALAARVAALEAGGGGGVDVTMNMFYGTTSISANTVATITLDLTGGDGACEASGGSILIPSDCKYALISFVMQVPVTASTAGRRFTQFSNAGTDTQAFNGEQTIMRNEFYIGNRNGSTFVALPGGLYTAGMYSPSAGTGRAWVRVLVFG